MVYVFATIELADGMRDQFLAAQRGLLPLVRAEHGCVEYQPTVEVPLADPAKSPPRTGCIFMHEKWASLEDLRAHLTAPHMKDFREQVQGMVSGVKVEVFQSV
jgi:quinol monooxygenase YgiN